MKICLNLLILNVQIKRLYIISGCNCMKATDIKDIRNRIVEGMKISALKFIKNKKEAGEKIIISEAGVIRIIEPKDL